MFARNAVMVALAAACAAPGAMADTVNMSGFRSGYSAIDTSMTGTVGVGQFQGTLNGASFVTYCTDIFESFNFNTTYTNYFVAATGSTNGFTYQQADMIGRLYTVANSQVDTRDESVAFQLAIWEILYDSSYQVGNVTGRGVFYTESGANSTQLSLANSWLTQASALGTSNYSVVRLASVDAPGANDGRQDFVIASAVPEPSTYALMAAGLGALGLMARRRQKRS